MYIFPNKSTLKGLIKLYNVTIKSYIVHFFYRIQKKSVSANKLKTMQWYWNILRKEQSGKDM